MHDPRVGRFFARDPLEKKYPWYSPYQFSGNRVIDATEFEGMEEKIVWYTKDSKKPIIFQMSDKSIKKNSDWTKQQIIFYMSVKNIDDGGSGSWSNGRNSYYTSSRRDGSMFISGRWDIWNGPTRGTLTVRENADGKFSLSYDSRPLNLEINYKTDWSITKKAIKTFNPIYPVPDPTIEGSDKYANTVSNYKTMVLAPVAVEANLAGWSEMGKIEKAFNITSIALDVDEMAGGENGSILEQKVIPEEYKGAFNGAKAAINLAGKTSALNELGNAEGGTEMVKHTAEAVNGTVNTINNASKINEKKE